MKTILLITTFILSFASFSQIDTLDERTFQFDFDSVHVSLWDIYFKESATPIFLGENVDDGSDIRPSVELKRVNLPKEKSIELLSALRDPKSYDNERAMLNHYNLVIKFYHNGIVSNRIELSTMTGNITSDNSSNGSYYQNNCSKSFGKHIENLLNKYQIIEQLEYDEVDLMGLRSN